MTASDQVTSPPHAESWWSDLRAALRGVQHYDYTEGPLGRALILLAVPMVAEMIMESVFAVADVFYVSRLGADAVATVGLTESMLTLIYTVAMGLSIGVTALVARRIGERNPEGAATVAGQGITLGLVLALGIGVAGALLAPGLLRIMGATPAVIGTGSGYTRIMLGGNGVILLLFLINAIFRGSGDAAISMRTLWLANGLNIVLAPCLIFGPGPFPALGVTGAALATTIGRGTGVCYQLYCLRAASARVRVKRRHLAWRPAAMLALIRLSASGTFQVFVGMASWIGLVRIIAGFGSAAVAGYTIGMRVIMFALLPSWGLSNAAATMVGQNLGAGKPDRAERAVWVAGFLNLTFLGVVGAAFLAGAGWIVGLFTTDPAVRPIAAACLRTVSMGFLFYAYGMVLTQSFNGAGDTRTPTLINLGCFWLLELPLAWILAHRVGLGPLGAFVGITVAFSSLAVVSAVVFRQGHWKARRV
ncbi:MAG TPA: MATE family efflux transporter [Gemmatimonadales bacterium]|nr:MATE family efflux transporter [Gemmatimonadales bacterium]